MPQTPLELSLRCLCGGTGHTGHQLWEEGEWSCKKACVQGSFRCSCCTCSMQCMAQELQQRLLLASWRCELQWELTGDGETHLLHVPEWFGWSTCSKDGLACSKRVRGTHAEFWSLHTAQGCSCNCEP